MKYLLIVSMFLLFHPAVELGESIAKWELAKEGDGIKTYTRHVEGASIHEVKAITSVSSSMKSLEKLIENVAAYPLWQVKVENGKVLKVINENESYIYYTVDVPWPFTDREIVVRSFKMVSKIGVVTFDIDAAPNYIKENEGFVRIRDTKGQWKFTPLGNGMIEVSNQFYADPGGSLPAWVINLFIVDAPFETFGNLKDRIEGE